MTIYGWRKAWLIALALLLVGQTIARMIGHVLAFNTAWIGCVLHLVLIGAWLGMIALIVWQLPLRWRGLRPAAIAFTLLMAGAHAYASYTDIFHLVWYHFVRSPAPIALIFNDPKLAFSLLSSINVDVWLAVLVIVVLIVVHVAFYAVIADPLTVILQRWMRASLPTPIRRWPRVPVWPAAVAPPLLLGVTMLVLPPLIWRYEMINRSARAMFETAPAALMVLPPPDGPAPAQIAPANPRPLVLIIVDALRSDRMGIFDPARGNTPNLDKLRAGGKLHAYAGYSTCTLSFCGIMSTLASRSWDQFVQRPPTLIDALARHGYRNHLILSGSHEDFGHLMRLYGRGIVQMWSQDRKPPADDRKAMRVLAETQFEDPNHSFLYMHLVSTHWGAAIEDRFRRPGEHAYDARVRQADAYIAEIFETLRAKGMLENALVVITADHGERMFPNNFHFHGGAPDEATTAVPLLVYDAAGGTWPANDIVSHIDVPPTFLRAIGGVNGEGWHGVPLQQPGNRNAVPIATHDTLGAIVRLDGNRYRYLCRRENGEELVQLIDGKSVEGTTLTGPDRDRLLPRLRTARIAATSARCNGK